MNERVTYKEFERGGVGVFDTYMQMQWIFHQKPDLLFPSLSYHTHQKSPHLCLEIPSLWEGRWGEVGEERESWIWWNKIFYWRRKKSDITRPELMRNLIYMNIRFIPNQFIPTWIFLRPEGPVLLNLFWPKWAIGIELIETELNVLELNCNYNLYGIERIGT